ncbi:YfgM family protein [Coralloluteibacterium stylophorae]|uniref:Tetratricopeptide repeat protein n=1 Tax=Coralloluteibacterium stylophorae TaxID=1776034 RepID=A0A8J7VVE7_9GAMM|nr:tetratricopeptide repeat protein [Coralloluteibacterium stylophorae]MBS7455966.1 tetratricopeptide repeat protein [Coralloluteibacterium stylophorae]
MRENGAAILGGVAVGLALIAGGFIWKNHRASEAEDVAAQHYAVIEAAGDAEAGRVADLAHALRAQHPDSAYAVLAALHAARAQLDAGDAAAAAATLQEAAGAAADPALDGLVVLRLARLQLAAGEPADALATLGRLEAGSYTGLAADLRGDAQRALGETEQARAAYDEALTHLDAAAPIRALVELKLTDLGGAPAASPEA